MICNEPEGYYQLDMDRYLDEKDIVLNHYMKVQSIEAVKRCVFQLIGIAEQKQQALSLGADQNGNTTAAVASQSNDGVSISFNTMSASQVFDTLKNETSRIIYVTLNGVTNELGRKLLYRGIYPDDE